MKLSLLLSEDDKISTISKNSLIGNISDFKILDQKTITENESFSMVIKEKKIIFNYPFFIFEDNFVRIYTKGETATIFIIMRA